MSHQFIGVYLSFSRQAHVFLSPGTSLVGGLEHDSYLFHSVGNVIIPIDELIFFQRGLVNHQPSWNIIQLKLRRSIQCPLDFHHLEHFPMGFPIGFPMIKPPTMTCFPQWFSSPPMARSSWTWRAIVLTSSKTCWWDSRREPPSGGWSGDGHGEHPLYN